MNLGYISYIDKLNDEYRKAFDYIEAFGMADNIDNDTSNEWLMELMDSMLEAQKADEPVEKIVGKDIDRFCEDFYNRYTLSDRVNATFRRLYSVIKIMFIIEVIDGLICMDEESFFMGGSSFLSPYIYGCICGMIISAIITLMINPLFRKKKISVKTYNIIINIVVIVVFVVCLITTNIVTGRFNIILPRFVFLALLGGYIIIYSLVRAVNNYRKYGSIREPKMVKVTMKERLNEDLKTELPNTWLRQFEKKNEKRVKKGKQPLTNGEFMESLVKRYDYKKQRMMTVLMTIGGGIIGAGLVIGSQGAFTVEGFNKMFESGTDVVIFLALIIGLCLLGGLTFSKLSKPGCEMFEKVKKECDNNGWTLKEYVEKVFMKN